MAFAAQWHTPHNRCVRFAPAVAGDHATLATGRPLRLTRTGLSPAGPRQLCLAHKQSIARVVIASEAKQSILPLRGEMDCFAALAMTWNCKHGFAISPRNAPEALMKLPPKEGVGNAGCPLHPRPRVHLVVVERTRVTTSTPESPDVPARNGFNGFLRALLGDRALLPPSPCGLKVLSSPVEPNEPPQDLTPASRRQDHTTSPSASSAVVLHAANRSRRAIRPALASHAQHCRVHRTPPRVRDDHDTPLWWGGMATVLELIWVRWQQIFFGKSEKKT